LYKSGTEIARKAETIQKTIQKHRIHKIENHTKQENKHKKNITKLKSSN
jgi:hypothetical protein